MIGYFIQSADDDICLVRLEGHQDTVRSFRYCHDMHMANLIMADGREDIVSVEISPPIHAALLYNDAILIVDMDGDDVLKEYAVPIDST